MIEKRATIIEKDGSKYTGEWDILSNMKHGNGYQVSSTGAIYEGYWANN